MSWIFTWVFIGIVGWFLAAGIMKPEKIYEFPFLAGMMAVSFILPQVPGVASDPFLPEAAFTKTILMGVFCLLMLRLGWSGRPRQPLFTNLALSEKKLLVVAFVFSACGAFFYYKLSRLPGDMTVGVQISGVPVIYLFFARLLVYGLAIAALVFARRPSIAAAAVIIVDVAFYLDRIVVTGKRAETLELLLIFALAFWFQKRWVVPRPAVITTLIVTTLAMSSMADYRQITRVNARADWSQIAQIDVVGNFEELWENGGLELRNAVQRIDHTDRTLDLDYGAFHWNRLVANFVPAQLVGADLKASLMVQTPAPDREYAPATGTTETGLVDAFQSFWYFGAFKFLILSIILSRIWGAAMAGSEASQIIYALSIVPAMHAISHQTDWVVQVWVHMLIFLAPALLFAVATNRQGASRELRPAEMASPIAERI